MTAGIAHTLTTPGTLHLEDTPKVPFARLVNVELRKMFNTRAGFWLGAITALLLALFMGVTLLVAGLNDDITLSASTFSQIMTVPVSLLLPVFAILTITSEWGQRTNLVTFTLEPNRLRVLAAKLVNVTILAVATLVVAIAFGALGNLLYGAVTGNEVVWDIKFEPFAWVLVSQLLYFFMAFAFAALMLSTPGSIAVYYIIALLLPLMVYGPLFSIFTWAQDIVPWLDINFAMAPLFEGTATGADYVRTAFTSSLWVLLPLGLGVRRLLRAEVK